MSTILLVDDEERMLDLLALYLEPHRYTCLKVRGGKAALDMVKQEAIDLVILDVMMPEMDGWTVCREIRAISSVPIIMLTAREQEEDVVKGLRLGADDYVTKPFSEQELIARIEALLRRSAPAKNISLNGLTWDEARFEVSYEGRPIHVTPKEFALLGILIKHPHQVFERDHLLELVWGYETETEARTVDSHVRNLREKIRDAGFPVEAHFQTVRGVGYKWVQ